MFGVVPLFGWANDLCLFSIWPPFFLSLAVVMDVIDSRQVACKLYKGLSDALICTDEFITKVVHR